MQDTSPSRAPLAYPPASEVNCPCCQCKLVRERRRIVDRLCSLTRPVRRYRCENFACQWKGNLTKPDAGRSRSAMAASAKGEGDRRQQTSGVPASFVVHMILVVVGVVVVITFSTMEPAVLFGGGEYMRELVVAE